MRAVNVKVQMQNSLWECSQGEQLRDPTHSIPAGLTRIAPAVCKECRVLNFAGKVRKVVQSQKNIGVARMPMRS
jgi:hypothetical protein